MSILKQPNLRADGKADYRVQDWVQEDRVPDQLNECEKVRMRIIATMLRNERWSNGRARDFLQMNRDTGISKPKLKNYVTWSHRTAVMDGLPYPDFKEVAFLIHVCGLRFDYRLQTI